MIKFLLQLRKKYILKKTQKNKKLVEVLKYSKNAKYVYM